MVILLLILINLPVLVLAFDPVGLPGGPAGPPSPTLVPCGQRDGPDCNYQYFLQLIKNVFDYLVMFAIPLATATIVIGGVIMMMAGTNDSKRSQAKKIIWMAVWGLVIVLASWLIVKLVFDALVKTELIPDSFKT